MKRYKHKEQYEYISRTRCTNLFKKMLADLPGLAKQIAPQGFENSIYHAKYFPTAEQVYHDYRQSRALSYKDAKRDGTDYLLKDIIPFADFLKTFNPAQPDLRRELLNLFIESMQEIFNRNALVLDRKFHTYKRRWGLEFEECMFKAVETFFPEYTTGEQWEFFSVRTYQFVDMKPVYCYVFSLLKKEKLDYRYGVVSSKIFDELTGTLESFAAEAKIKQILSKDEEHSHVEEELDPSRLQYESDHQLLELIMRPPPVVVAYFEVYGHWPDNYPPADD
jgi:hypothetical protein